MPCPAPASGLMARVPADVVQSGPKGGNRTVSGTAVSRYHRAVGHWHVMSVRLSSDEAEALRALSLVSGHSMAEIIREAVRDKAAACRDDPVWRAAADAKRGELRDLTRWLA